MKSFVSIAMTLSLVLGIAGWSLAAEKGKGDKGDKKAGPTPAEVFKARDANGDGVLSLEEFVGKKDKDAKPGAKPKKPDAGKKATKNPGQKKPEAGKGQKKAQGDKQGKKPAAKLDQGQKKSAAKKADGQKAPGAKKEAAKPSVKK